MNRLILVAGLATALMVAATSGHAETAPGQATAATRPSGTSVAVLGEPARVEVAFVLDTTGSMTGLIDGAKRKIWAIADEIRKTQPNAEIRIGLVAYRDRGDAYVTDKTELSTDIHAVYGKLLQFQAQGGGDWPESVNEALSVAVNGLGWTKAPDTRRLIFLVGDAPPHMDYVQDIPFTDTLKIAEREGIVVDALQAGNAPDTALAWKTIAQLGHGRYVQIPQSGGVVSIPSPFDDEIIQLQLRLHRTIVPYGSKKQQSEVRSKAAMAAAAPASAASDMASYGVRAGSAAARKVVTGEGDLVADVIAKRAEAAKVAREDLPAELQALSKPELEATIAAKSAERDHLQSELAAVVAKRDAFVAAERAKQPAAKDGFDRVVEDLVREQVK
ncbi:VWA domain-containing protein [Siculibacillus lacustris]|uniref:VWA domain-containing protein n=1 Tax=Siculibacillus lacustris TaxID=1549641 RepID=A0A4Q9VHY1_9HYPH|nr:vWA domain-containing protein [Siculibacillus lacustris]TBW33882.1 VWA domain-containing protein [Siculibacillus lacustris]